MIIGGGVIATGGVVGTPYSDVYSLKLNGTNKWGRVTNNANLNFTHSFSVSVWVKNGAVGGEASVVGKTDYGLGRRQWFLEQYFADVSKISMFISPDGGSTERVTSVSTVFNSTWKHVCVTWGNADGSYKLKLYVNGTLDATTATTTTTLASFTTDLSIGALFASGSAALFYSGYMDELAVFNTELSSTNVSVCATHPTVTLGSIPGLVSWWRCGDLTDTSSTMVDQTNSNNATLNNCVSADYKADVPT